MPVSCSGVIVAEVGSALALAALASAWVIVL
jgi:hypothetical protein